MIGNINYVTNYTMVIEIPSSVYVLKNLADMYGESVLDTMEVEYNQAVAYLIDSLPERILYLIIRYYSNTFNSTFTIDDIMYAIVNDISSMGDDDILLEVNGIIDMIGLLQDKIKDVVRDMGILLDNLCRTGVIHMGDQDLSLLALRYDDNICVIWVIKSE